MSFLRVPLILTAALIAVAVVAPGKPNTRLKPKFVPTYAKDVAPILFAKCSSCHHEGEVAPFSLMSYEQAKNMAPTIASAVKQKIMPPWQASSHGEFSNERLLTPAQISTLQAWAEAGAPAGDLKAAPKPPVYTPGWRIGTPDFVAAPSKPYEVSADGADEYRCFVIPTNFPEARYVSAVELRPGNRKVLHHVLIYIDTSGAARKKDGRDGKPGYESFGGPGFQPSGSFGGWAPGLQPRVLGPNTGFYLPKGADIVLQMHYHKDGKPESDLTKLGLKFAQGAVDKQVRWESVGEEVFRIPAGDSHYPVTASMKMDKAVTLFDIMPHMHMLGHDMTVYATLPNGEKKQLVQVNGYDFNWQTTYEFRQPIHLPAGSELSLIAHYDNSAGNPRNPNQPPKPIHFGEQTTDEMCYAFFSYTYDMEHVSKGIKVSEGASADEKAIGHIFDKFDVDHDGFLDATELAEVIRYFEGNEHAAKPQDPAQAAKLVIALFGKTKKGGVTKAEFAKIVHSG